MPGNDVVVGNPLLPAMQGGVNVQAEAWQVDPNIPIAVAHGYFLIVD